MEVTYEELINMIRQYISSQGWSINEAAAIITEYWRKKKKGEHVGSYRSSLYRAMNWEPGKPENPSKRKVKQLFVGLGLSLDEVKKARKSAEEIIFREEAERFGGQMVYANQMEGEKTMGTVIPCVFVLKQPELHAVLRNVAQGLVAAETAKETDESRTQSESGGTAFRYAGERGAGERKFVAAADDRKPYGETPKKEKVDGEDPENSR